MTFEDYKIKKAKEFGEWAKNDVKRFLEKNEGISFDDWKRGLKENADYYSISRVTLIAKNNGVILFPQQAEEVRAIYFEKLEGSYKVQLAKFEKAKKVVAKYQDIIDEAQKLVDDVDLTNLTDGFPCGSAFVYVDSGDELGKALRTLKGGNGRNHPSDKIFDCKFPVKFNHHAQCIDFDRKLCDVLECFLRDKGIQAKTYSWID